MQQHMTKPQYKNKNWLENQYLVKECTLKQIGEKCSTSWGTIAYWCKKHNIKLRDPKDPDFVRIIQKRAAEKRTKRISKEWIRERYEDKGMTLTEIAKEWGCNWRTIQRRCNYFGIPTRKAIVRNWKTIERYVNQDLFVDIKSLKNALVKLYGYKCMYPKCEYGKFVELHHSEGKNVRNQSGITSKRHTQNKISTSLLLCPNHHKEADYGLITKEEIQSILNSRELKT